jgi:tellurite resistance protein TehA-like permease
MRRRPLEPSRRAPAAGLPPGWFTAVMATGTVSVAAHQHRQDALSSALLTVALGAYAVLAVLTIARPPAGRAGSGDG